MSGKSATSPLELGEELPSLGDFLLLPLLTWILAFVVSAEEKAYAFTVEVDEDAQEDSRPVQLRRGWITSREMHRGNFRLAVSDPKFMKASP